MSDSWQLTLPCTRAEAEALYDADELLSGLSPTPSIVTREVEAFNDARWELLAYFDGKPSARVLQAIHALIPSAAKVRPSLVNIPDEDWLTISQQGLKPVSVGRFYIHTGSNAGSIPSGTVPFRIAASQAFGTGGHETTSGCLHMLDAMKRRGQRFSDIADIGTGTGLLAFAANHLWPGALVTASDIDPVSVMTATDNAAANFVALGRGSGRITMCVASGTDHPLIRRRSPYDLVVANILAGPLIELAAALSVITAEKGSLILAGLLDTQTRQVIRAYRAEGFRVAERVDTGDWPCLRLVKRRRYGWQRPRRTDGRTSQPPGDFGTW